MSNIAAPTAGGQYPGFNGNPNPQMGPALQLQPQQSMPYNVQQVARDSQGRAARPAEATLTAVPGATTQNAPTTAAAANHAKLGFFARLFGRGSQQQNTGDIEAGAAADASAAQPLEPDMFQNQDEMESSDIMMVSYTDSFKYTSDNPNLPILETALFLQFDGVLGPKPIPARQLAIESNHVPREDYGLFVERPDVLGRNSLFKMEQRLVRQGMLDRVALSELTGSAGAGPRLVNASRVKPPQLLQLTEASQVPPSPALALGNLPTVTEAPEGEETQPVVPFPGGPQVVPSSVPLVPNLTAAPPHFQLQPFGPEGQPQPYMPDTMPGFVPGADQQPWPVGVSPGGQQQAMQMGAGMFDPVTGAYMGSGPEMMMQILPDGSMVQMTAPAPPPIQISRWLDDTGLMVYEAEPLKAEKERPWRRYDQDKETTATFRRAPIVEIAGEQNSEGSKTYRLDIELGRLEFLLHPGMGKEDLLAARLLAAFREFKRRESVGLIPFFANKLAALEEALLGSREKLFSASMDERCEDAELNILTSQTAQIEKEVAETRQLKEEEEVLMWRAANAMQLLYGEIMQVRQSQGYWITNLQLTVLQRPPEEMLWSMGMGVSRDRLDLELLLAEDDAVMGFPPPPYAFPVPQWDLNPATGSLGLFRPRRVETMCGAHMSAVETLKKRLQVLQLGEGAEYDLNVQHLQAMLDELGAAPKRRPRSPSEQQAARQMAMQRLASADVGVLRVPVLQPILSVNAEPEGQHLQGAPDTTPPLRLPDAKPAKRLRYYSRLYVNGKLLDSSEDATLDDDFNVQFKDTFSVQVVRWPESVSVQLWEKGTISDTFVSQVYIAVPGVAGSPHIDSQAKPYQFTSQTPFKTRANRAATFTQGPTGVPGGMGMVPSAGPGGEANPPHLVYPAGLVFVRCGWVAEMLVVGSSLEEAVVRNGHAMLAYENPLADLSAADDVEAGRSLMPPLPHLTIDRILRRAAERIGMHKATRAQLLRWLGNNQIDPNDPRNAALMELLKAQEAQSGNALGGLFRLDVPPAVALVEIRAHSKRFSFLARRWGSGQYRNPDKSVLKATRTVRAPVALSAKDTESLENLYLDSLSLFEMAPGGVGQPVSQALLARQERALQMQSGPHLTHAIEEREKRLTEFAKRIHAAAVRLAGGKQARRKFTTDEVVKDVPLPEWKLDWSFWSWSVWDERRPLKPTKREKGRNEGLPYIPEDLELLITVQRCSNLPARASATTAALPPPPRADDLRHDGDLADPDVTRGGSKGLQCFVEVVYRTSVLRRDEHGNSMEEERVLRRRTASTEVDEFPVFNEQLSLPVFGPGLEATSSAINETNNFITINVFDEFINHRVTDLRSVQQGDGISDPLRYPERERRFLGCIRMPLSAIYQMQVLEGIFKLESPPVILGYQQASDRPACVHLCMALRPQVVPPTMLEEERISGEAEDITLLATRWQANALELPQCSRRVIKALAIDADGTSILVTRFISPTPLPPTLAQLASNPQSAAEGMPLISITELVMLKIARFVSLIPYVEDSSLAKRRTDVWCTTSEFIHLTAGDSEEHAHLLAGYFLEIGQQAFVILGASTLGGRSAFVMTTGQASFDPNNPQNPPPSVDLDESRLRLWNPLTGVCSSVKDATCEMRQVGTLYDHTNMWANTQITAQPWEMEWKLGNNQAWLPFFGTYLPQRELATLQVPPTYEELDSKFYDELGKQVEEAVRDAIQKARSSAAYVTKPDNKISRLLKELLMQVPTALDQVAVASLGASLALAGAPEDTPGEALARLGERHKYIVQLQNKHNEEVSKQSRADMISGHILALPFSDRYVDAVSEAVLNTGIHRIADERVKYSMAAYVERGGASFACCVWIYVAAMRDIRA